MNSELAFAWRSLWRRARRTAITVAALAFCNALLVFAIAIQIGSYDAMIRGTLDLYGGHVQIAARGYQDRPEMHRVIPSAGMLVSELQETFPDLAFSPRAEAFVLAATERRSAGLQVVGVEPSTERSVSNLHRAVTEGAFLGQPEQWYIGDSLARRLAVAPGDELSYVGSGRRGSFAAGLATVGGVFDAGVPVLDQNLVIMPLAVFSEVFAMGDGVHRIIVRAPELDMRGQYAADITRFLQQRGRDDLEVLDWQALQPGLMQAMYGDFFSAWVMYGVLILLVVASVVNTQMMSVLERSREFGVMKALGLPRRRLGGLIVLETVFLSGMGFVVGMLLGLLVVLWFYHNGLTLPGMDEFGQGIVIPEAIYPSMHPLSLLLGPLVVFAFSLLAAVYPVVRLWRLQPVAAMRSAL